MWNGCWHQSCLFGFFRNCVFAGIFKYNHILDFKETGPNIFRAQSCVDKNALLKSEVAVRQISTFYIKGLDQLKTSPGATPGS